MIIKRNRSRYMNDTLAGYGNTMGWLGGTRGPCPPGEWDCSTWIDVELDYELAPSLDQWRKKKKVDSDYWQARHEARSLGINAADFHQQWVDGMWPTNDEW